MSKLYECQINFCTTLSKIRSKIKNKDSEYYGLYVCNYHASINRETKVSDQTRRTREKRKETRKDYPQFYQEQIEKAKNCKCLECGNRLQGNSTEIPHVLSKSLSPEVAIDDNNILKYLCANCHTRFDSSLSSRKEMKCFQKSVLQYKILIPKLINVTAETLFYDKYLHNPN